MTIAKMDTGHYEFLVVGRNNKEAIQALCDAFHKHVSGRGDEYCYGIRWGHVEDPDPHLPCDNFTDINSYFGISLCVDAMTNEVFRDGSSMSRKTPFTHGIDISTMILELEADRCES